MGPRSLLSASSRLGTASHWLEYTRGFWTRLGRPVTVPATEAEWQRILDAVSTLEGPYDWALCLGPLCTGRGRRLTSLGKLIEAWRMYDYAESREALSRLACRLLNQAVAHPGFDMRIELPWGYESGTPVTLAELLDLEVPDPEEFWGRQMASTYNTLPAHPELADRALRVRAHVTGRRVLLTTLVHDRPELASACSHLLRSHGATWVGLLALADDCP